MSENRDLNESLDETFATYFHSWEHEDAGCAMVDYDGELQFTITDPEKFAAEQAKLDAESKAREAETRAWADFHDIVLNG